MKFSSITAVALLATAVVANPVPEVETRDAAPVLGEEPVLFSPVELKKREELEKRKKKGGSSSNSTSDAVHLTPDGTILISGAAILSSAYLLLA
ncbi:hypothetical protein H2198_010681 [Neophaeococcomyces mojaviensis]|uniref:Uncharacterized protein n=1 Tax=Neophaeococcomyces mojaviensis TaxID=3383035 RepID=A0ACC2ZQZ6_9EURO|nr:hypothetical protein H2198_010681 [Knufia sp. JES_112]